MEMILIRLNMDMEGKHSVSRFLSGLKKEIREKVEMYKFSSLPELYELATKVESHLKGKNKIPKVTSKPWEKPNYQKKPWESKPWSTDNKGPSIPKKDPKTAEFKKEITCFKCKQKGHYARECPN